MSGGPAGIRQRGTNGDAVDVPATRATEKGGPEGLGGSHLAASRSLEGRTSTGDTSSRRCWKARGFSPTGLRIHSLRTGTTRRLLLQPQRTRSALARQPSFATFAGCRSNALRVDRSDCHRSAAITRIFPTSSGNDRRARSAAGRVSRFRLMMSSNRTINFPHPNPTATASFRPLPCDSSCAPSQILSELPLLARPSRMNREQLRATARSGPSVL